VKYNSTIASFFGDSTVSFSRIIFLLRYHYDAYYLQVQKWLVSGCVWQPNFVMQYLWVLSMELALNDPFGAWDFEVAS